jgi:hypothetical protein
METVLIIFHSIIAVLGIFNCALFFKKFLKTQDIPSPLPKSQSPPLTVSHSAPDIKIIYEIILKKMNGMAENSVYKFEAPRGLSFTGKFRPEYKKLCRLCLEKNLYLISDVNDTTNTTISIYLLKCPDTLVNIVDNIDYLTNTCTNLKGFVRYKIGTDMDHNEVYRLLPKCDNKGSKITALKRTHDNTVKVYYG